MSNEDYDRFHDVIAGSEGIFTGGLGAIGDGLKEFDSAKTVVVGPSKETPQGGVLVELACRSCGRPHRIVVEWPEVIALEANLAPQQFIPNAPTQWAWSKVTGAWWPELHCQCQSPMGPMFTPAEARAHLQTAMQKRWLNPAEVAQWRQRANAVAAQVYGAR